MKFFGYYQRRNSTTTPYIKRNNAFVDPTIILNGTSSPDEASNFLAFISGDPSYAGNDVSAGVAMGKTAAGNVFRIFPGFPSNTTIAGSDASMPASVGRGWRMNQVLNGAWADSNWLHSITVQNLGGVAVAVQVGLRIWYGSTASVIDGNYLSAFSTNTPQYGGRVSFNAAVESASIVFSFSVTGSGPAGTAFVISGQYFFEEWFLKIDTASSKAAAHVTVHTNG